MTVPGSRWQVFGDAASPDEQAALNALRKILPDSPTTHAWTNVTFRDRTGRAGEFDVILLHANGLYTIELKGWHGRISGDQQQWRVTDPNGRVRLVRDPYILLDNKTKRLATELQAEAHGVQIPFIRPLVVMHGHGSRFELTVRAASTTFALDGYQVQGLESIRGVFDAPPANLGQAIDANRADQLCEVLARLGLHPRPKVRMVGSYDLLAGERVAEGPDWTDYRVPAPIGHGEYRRIRQYTNPPKASADQVKSIERRAYRELKLPDPLGHPGVVKPLEILLADEGPALVFRDYESVPLLEYLRGAVAADVRLSLLRQLAEILDYAHKLGVQHRGLTPSAVHVEVTGAGPRLTVRDWGTGHRDDAGTTQATLYAGVLGIPDVVAQDQWLYLAPESHGDQPDPVALDVYGLGALAYLILTGSPPAKDMAALQERWTVGGLDPAVDLDGLPPLQCDLVREATTPQVIDRIESVAAFLDRLNAALEQSRPEEPEPVADPREADVGELIADRWEVKARLGAGAAGIALLVDDYDRDYEGVVLKLAVDADAETRIRDECEALAALDHPRIVQVLDGPVDVDGHTGMVIADAGRPTLGRRLLDEGRLTLEQLENYGRDLFEAMAYLAEQGVFHRDIKPDNLGVREVRGERGDRSRHLVLFDFSLAKEPLDRTRSGTRGYMDPFLGTGRRRRYDSAAERFAVAATLFEMATGTKPVWGDGQSDPVATAAEVHLAESLFEPEVAPAMVAFFAQALAREADARFDDVHAMAHAWSAVFPASSMSQVQEPDVAARDAMAAQAVLTTGLAQAGLTARAASAARRLGADTVGQLLDVSPFDINNTPGIGVLVRSELQRRRRAWAQRLGRDSSAESVFQAQLRSIERTQAALVPRTRSKAVVAAPLARRLLNLDPPGDTDAEVGAPEWPDLATAAADAGLTDDRDAVASALVDYWGRSSTVANLAPDVTSALAALGGSATVAELADRLVALRGSSAEGPARRRNAIGVIRAVVAGDAGATLLTLRHGDQVLVTTVEDDAADVRLEAFAALAEAVDTAVADVDAPLGAGVGLELVRTHPRTPDTGVTDPQRLLALAANASTRAALSPRTELYPRGMTAGKAVAAVVAAVPGRITDERLRHLVAARFPAAAPVPGRPALDALLAASGSALSWDSTTSAYVRADSSASLLSTGTRMAPLPEVAAHDDVHQALLKSLASRSATVVTATPAQLPATARRLADRYGVERIDVTSELIRAMQRRADAAGVDWAVVLRADAAAADSVDRANLHRLVSDAMDTFWPGLVADDRPLLLTELTPLARYGQLPRIAELLDTATARPAARWLLVGKRADAKAPTLDGAAVPTASGTWVSVPDAAKESR